MNRYSEVVGRILADRPLPPSGITAFLVPPRQQATVAQAILEHVAGAVVGPLSRKLVTSEPRVLVAAGIAEPKSLSLSALNDRRQRLATRDALVVLVLDRRDMILLRRFAGDASSVISSVRDVPFVPDTSVDPESARRQLNSWQESRFGRLDLRGFIRSEREEVAWHVSDIYQTLRAEFVPNARQPESTGGTTLSLMEVLALPSGRAPIVILGHPGTGKSFFLRHVALQAARLESLFDIARPIPVLLPLAAFTAAPGTLTLAEFLVEWLLEEDLSAANLVPEAMRDGSALLLLDGLDELPDRETQLRVIKSIETLQSEVPSCRIVVTSRIAGYADAPLTRATHWQVLPFDGEAIRNFLRAWCAMYAQELRGKAARREGEREGTRLARDVLADPNLTALAANPLLLTVLAIVHRAGVRLPDHRVELYAHATKVLVERWNTVRSLKDSRPAPPLKATDAVRLLGPVALSMIESGSRSSIDEETLRDLIDKSLTGGNLRATLTSDDVMRLFKREIGLLVEQGPGSFAFLHLTLTEYFAAWELVRSGALETLATKPRDAFYPQWREVLLLAAGELGVNRADDLRLSALVDRLLASAASRQGRPSSAVPSLLGGLLADDPSLSAADVRHLVEALVPEWWFRRHYGASTVPLVVTEATNLLRQRIARHGKVATPLAERVKTEFGNYIDPLALDALRAGGPPAIAAALDFIEATGVDYGPALWSLITDKDSELRRGAQLKIVFGNVELEGNSVRISADVSSFLVARAAEVGLELRGNVLRGPTDFVPVSVAISKATRRDMPNGTIAEWSIPWPDGPAPRYAILTYSLAASSSKNLAQGSFDLFR